MKLIIIDDDKLVSSSLKTILESQNGIEVIAIGNSGNEAITLFQKYKPDILLLDIRMNDMSGLEAASEILISFPEAKILFLTTFLDDEYIQKALEIGAKGYILKQDFNSILPALQAVASGQTVFGSEITNKLTHINVPFNYEQYNLSYREFEIIQLVANGLSNKEISDQLYLSEGTIRNYLSIILDKLQLRDRTQLAIFYYKQK